jgi:hypothetical protein
VFRNEEAVDDVGCVFTERSDLSFIATEGGEQATQANCFSFHVTVQFRSIVMRDKKKGSAHSTNRARVVTRRGEAEEEERACESLLLTHSYHKGESSPYMLVQLLLN